MKTANVIALLAALSFSLESDAAYAGTEFLLDTNVRVVRHDKRTTRHTFKSSQRNPLSLWGILFERNIWEAPTAEEKRLLHYEELDSCARGSTDLEEVYSHTPGTEGTDVVYYNLRDVEQARRANKHDGLKVPYNPALVANKKTNIPNSWQAFARFIKVDCLPFRFRFVYVGNKRYMEFRRGSDVWK